MLSGDASTDSMGGSVSDIQLEYGVWLERRPGGPPTGDDDRDGDDYKEALGQRGRHIRGSSGVVDHVAVLGRDVLEAAARGVGEQISIVAENVLQQLSEGEGAKAGTYTADKVDLTFGVKCVLGAGKAIEAFLSASSEATLQVTVSFKPKAP